MTLLSRAVSAFTRAPVVERVPLTTGTGLFDMRAGLGQSGATEQLSTYAAIAWIFAVVSRIGEAVGATDWKLFRTGRGERVEVDDHPALTLWLDANPFFTGQHFVEAFQQHNDLTGEAWLLVVPNRMREPAELWPLRPDRVFPIPSVENFVSHYEYKIGGKKIQLPVEQMIPILRPNPMNPYRGAGAVQALLPELNAEHLAILWSQQFFKNSARPGGIIAVDESLSDAEFERMKAHWNAQHQGITNAHRVAFLEKATWQEVGVSQRDMQFEQGRRLTRDNILGAFGVPRSVMGITDDVNRANAEAGEVTFAKWVIRPRLRRIRAALNERLLPLFNAEGFEFDFVDPVPEDRTMLVNEAVQGWNGKILRLNEARRRLGEDAVDEAEGGDDFKPDAPTPFSLSVKRAVGDDTLLTNPVQRAEAAMRRGWSDRLRAEVAAITAHINQAGKGVVKIEVTDLDSYDWDWWAKYGPTVIDEIAEVVAKALTMDFPDLAVGEVQRIAGAYARHRGAELLQVTGDVNVVRQTRQRVGELVAETIENGDSLKTLEKRLREDFMFSRSRAERVARTETATGLGQGHRQAALSMGRNEKHWRTQGAGDPRVDETCLLNEAQGWIAISEIFLSGHDTVPAHISCQCKVDYRTAELHDGETEAFNFNGRRVVLQEGRWVAPEGRCPQCSKLLLRDVSEAVARCPKCKVNIRFQGGKATVEAGNGVDRT